MSILTDSEAGGGGGGGGSGGSSGNSDMADDQETSVLVAYDLDGNRIEISESRTDTAGAYDPKATSHNDNDNDNACDENEETGDEDDSKGASASSVQYGFCPRPVIDYVANADCVRVLGFETVFGVPEELENTRGVRYARMSKALKAIVMNMQELKLEHHFQYVTDLISLMNTMDEKQYPKARLPVWFGYFDAACNCIRFEVLNRALDFARRFIHEKTLQNPGVGMSETELRAVALDASLVRSMLLWCQAHALDTWKDALRVFHKRCATDIHDLAGICGGAACWFMGQIAMIQAARPCVNLKNAESAEQKTAKDYSAAAAQFKFARDQVAVLPSEVSLVCEGSWKFPAFQNAAHQSLSFDTTGFVLSRDGDVKEEAIFRAKPWSQRVHAEFLNVAGLAYAELQQFDKAVGAKCAAAVNGSYVMSGFHLQSSCISSGVDLPTNAAFVVSDLERLQPTPRPMFEVAPECIAWHALDLDLLTIPLTKTGRVTKLVPPLLNALMCASEPTRR